ncbi:MAG TPA: phosphatase PAP2 family protein [Cyclobacteriaceae bacterium]|nr:phosphatase PAP2 family protein [Cyclobacteriaceae bacterium]
MKAFKILSLVAIVLMFVTSACEEIDSAEHLKLLDPDNVDANAGSWTMILPITNNQFAASVPAPAATTAPAYINELTAIKTAQARLTSSEKKIVQYWGAGGVLRWNQIMRELVAKYALAPAPNADGTYPVPIAENPWGDPAFPFANPPYAARAYAYVSIGQYEALKSAWYFKYQYNRPAPYVTDQGVQALLPQSTLPSYPSEDAVLSGVTAELLKLLFPGEVDFINSKASEQRYAAMWAGKATTSDISAGLALGNAVAGYLTAPGTGRFRTDGMGAAGGTKAQWDVLIDSAKLHYTKIGIDASNEIFWKSMDAPARPPMLPFFGNVRGWFLTPDQFKAERAALGPPPSTSSEQMKEELAEVYNETEKVDRDKLHIVHFWADGGGTYTPPGHWNDIAADYVEEANFSEVRAARAFAYLNGTMLDAAVGCWGVKYYWFNPRPSQLDPSIKTLTGLPNFPSYTSGHSTFSASASVVLSYLFPAGAATFQDYLREASISRLYGRIHYRTDIEKGNTHGIAIGNYAVTFASNDGAN